jgi:hypothetical protein
METALTFRGASNMNDSSNATSVRVLDCQHFDSSKFEPSLDVKTLTSPGAYAQFTFKPEATRREFKTPVQVTPWTARLRNTEGDSNRANSATPSATTWDGMGW